jgi:hypothetical protein
MMWHPPVEEVLGKNTRGTGDKASSAEDIRLQDEGLNTAMSRRRRGVAGWSKAWSKAQDDINPISPIGLFFKRTNDQPQEMQTWARREGYTLACGGLRPVFVEYPDVVF